MMVGIILLFPVELAARRISLGQETFEVIKSHALKHGFDRWQVSSFGTWTCWSWRVSLFWLQLKSRSSILCDEISDSGRTYEPGKPLGVDFRRAIIDEIVKSELSLGTPWSTRSRIHVVSTSWCQVVPKERRTCHLSKQCFWAWDLMTSNVSQPSEIWRAASSTGNSSNYTKITSYVTKEVKDHNLSTHKVSCY